MQSLGRRDDAAKNPQMKVTQTQGAIWERARARSIVANWLAAGEQIDVVCANTDERWPSVHARLESANTLSGGPRPAGQPQA